MVLFGDLVGLLYYACCAKDSTIYRIGDLAHDQRVSLYVAITTEDATGPAPMPLEKVRILNALFNERLGSPGKKVLILPDLFGLHREIPTSRSRSTSASRPWNEERRMKVQELAEQSRAQGRPPGCSTGT